MKGKDIIIHKGVGAKVRNYDILDLETGEMFNFVEDSRLKDVSVFAGKGFIDYYGKKEKQNCTGRSAMVSGNLIFGKKVR